MTIHVPRQVAHVCVSTAAFFMSVTTPPAWANTPPHAADENTLIVRNDPGGSVRKRFEQIKQLQAEGTKIEIREGFCLSSCTMYLGLENTCVVGDARFGFHGPQRFAGKLTREQFQEWSIFIAQFYPAPIKEWYLEQGHTKVNGYYKISGTELIRLGVQSCDEP